MKLNTRRIKRLIDFMEKLPRSANRHFLMRWWFVHEGGYGHAHKIGEFVTAETLQHCGTKACALGWAATIPAFQKAGLRIKTESAGAAPIKQAKRIFGLTSDQVDELFVQSTFHERPMNDVTTPKQWAKQARKLLTQWTK